MGFIDEKISERLGGSSFGKDEGTYKFAVIKESKARARQLNPCTPLIDMGVGEPDTPAESKIVDVLYREAGKTENRFYSDNGIQEFYEAAMVHFVLLHPIQYRYR